MTEQRPINLNPRPDALEVFRIDYPPPQSHRRGVTITPMKFIPHDGKAKT